MDKLSVYHLEDGEHHWVVARSKKDAVAYHFGEWGNEYEDSTDEITVKEMDDSDSLSILLDIYDDDTKETKSCKEWIEDEKTDLLKSDRKGVCIASTCY